jgi:predicted transcriptional regulator
MGAKKDKIRQQAEEYYLDNIEATQQQVAELFGVTQKTVSSWATSGDWNEKRINLHASPIKIKQLLQQELLNVASGQAAKLNADSISKLMSALDKCDKKADPIVVARVMKDFASFVSESDAHFAVKLTDWMKKFLQHRINQE